MNQKKQPLQISIDAGNSDLQNENAQPSQIINKSQNNKSSSSQTIVGQCQYYISKNEIKSRELDQFQKPTQKYKHWQPLARHFRNIQYTNQNVRKKQTLIQCIDFMCKEYLPYYRQIFEQQNQRKRFQLFLYDRVRAIRCQFYVQNIFEPKSMMRLLKLTLFLETMIGDRVQITCLEPFLNQGAKKINDPKFHTYYEEALQFAIFWYKKQCLVPLLQTHFQFIQTSPKLLTLIQKKLKIISNNYFIFLKMLSSNQVNIYTRLILWSQMQHIKQLVIQMYKKSRMRQKAKFLCKVLGYSSMEGWIDISKSQEFEKLQQNKTHYDLEITLWVGEDQLLSALEGLEKYQTNQELKQQKNQQSW